MSSREGFSPRSRTWIKNSCATSVNTIKNPKPLNGSTSIQPVESLANQLLQLTGSSEHSLIRTMNLPALNFSFKRRSDADRLQSRVACRSRVRWQVGDVPTAAQGLDEEHGSGHALAEDLDCSRLVRQGDCLRAVTPR